MKNINDKALQLLREYFELPKSRTLPLDLMLSDIAGSHEAISFTYFLEDRLHVELDEIIAEKITLGNVKRFVKIFRSLKNGR